MKPISISINFERISDWAKRTVWNWGVRAFWIILLLVLLDLILGGLVFYKYVFLAEAARPIASGTIIKFDEKSYSFVLTHINLQPSVAPDSATE